MRYKREQTKNCQKNKLNLVYQLKIQIYKPKPMMKVS